MPEEVGRLLRRMRLPYLRGIAPEVCATARAQRWDPAEVLRVLLQAEVEGRDRATWDQTASNIPKPTQQALLTLEWVGRGENLVLCGPSGTGKSHFCEAVASAVIDSGRRVAWFTLESLTGLLGRAKVDGSVAKVVSRVTNVDLIVIDDIGMLPAGQDAAEAFYRVVDAAYERRSIAVSSNLHPSGFDTIMPKTLATATVDRLLHHAHVVLTEGSSHRLAEATAGTGVLPLA